MLSVKYFNFLKLRIGLVFDLRCGNVVLGGLFAMFIHVFFDYFGPVSELIAGLIPALLLASSYGEGIAMAIMGSLLADSLSGLIILGLLRASALILPIPDLITGMGYAFVIVWILQGMLLSSLGALAGYKIKTLLQRTGGA